VLTSIAASSIMALMVMLGGEMIARSTPIVVATPTEPDPERTRVATDAHLLLVLEANAPGSVTLPCWLSDRPNAIVEPCRRWRDPGLADVPYRITECFVWIAASVIPVLLIVAAEGVIASTPEERIETRVLDSDYQQVLGTESQRIFVVCTTRAGVTTCMAFDLSLRAAANTSNWGQRFGSQSNAHSGAPSVLTSCTRPRIICPAIASGNWSMWIARYGSAISGVVWPAIIDGGGDISGSLPGPSLGGDCGQQLIGVAEGIGHGLGINTVASRPRYAK
jgi:hypothetical protein